VGRSDHKEMVNKGEYVECILCSCMKLFKEGVKRDEGEDGEGKSN
jgi:hypothetical protein